MMGGLYTVGHNHTVKTQSINVMSFLIEELIGP